MILAERLAELREQRLRLEEEENPVPLLRFDAFDQATLNEKARWWA